MKRLYKALLLTMAFMVLMAIPALASYRATYTITNGAGFDMLATTVDVENQWMADNGFFAQSALDTRIETLGGLQRPWMVAQDRTLTAAAVPADSQVNLYFTTDNTPLPSTDVITGNGGFITITDADPLEGAAAFDFTWDDAWLDTTAGGDAYLRKAASVSIGPDASTNGTINVAISDLDCLDYVRANVDYSRIPDHADFSFTDGGGNDEPFTIIAWVNLDDATNSTILSKRTGAANEWDFNTIAADTLHVALFDLAGGNIINADTVAITGDEGTWHHYACTYDGSEANTGLELFRDGVNATNARAGAGVYVGMADGASDVNIGARNAGTSTFMDGLEAEIKVYSAELTEPEILADYNGGHRTADLVSWWRIDEGVGLPQDSSGNAHHVNLNLADWVATFPHRLGTFLQATGISSGEHDLQVEFVGGQGNLRIDTVLEDTAALGGISLLANNNDWILGSDALPYMASYTHEVATVTHAYYSPNYMVENTGLDLTETTGGSDVNIEDNVNLAGFADDYWNGAALICITATNAINEGEYRVVVDFDDANDRAIVAPALPANTTIGDTFTIDFGTAVDRSIYGHDFDGVDDQVLITDAVGVQNIWDGGGSISLWTDVTSDGENNEGRIADKTDWHVRVDNQAAGEVGVTFYINFDGAADGEWTTTATEVTIGTWTNIVITYDADAVANNPTFYIDGTALTVGAGLTETTTPVGNRVTDIGDDLYIGDNAAGNRCYDGVLDEIWLFDAELTQADVTADYNGGDGAYIANNIPDWDLQLHVEDGSGATSTDASAFGNDGAITNALWVNGFVERTPGNGGTNDARITWGVSPTGVTVAMGGMVSSGTPTPGPGIVAPAIDYLPPSGGGDWDVQPAVTGALLTNPLRPFVTFMSDTTTITELLAWRFLGLIFVVLVFTLAVKWSKHLVITCIATGVAVIYMVVLTIWPWYALLLLGIGALTIAISERSPSV